MRIVAGTILSVMAFSLAGCGLGPGPDEQRNLEIVERLHAEAWSGGNMEILDDIIADNYVKHWAAFEPTVGREKLKQSIRSWRRSFPDWNEEVVAIEATGDMVFARWTETGTFTNDNGDMLANGNSVKAAGMGWFRFENGRIAEEWTIIDNWGTQIQLENSYDEVSHKPGWD